MSQRVATRMVRCGVYATISLPFVVLWMILISSIFGTIFGLLFVGVGFLLLPFALLGIGLTGDVERWLLEATLDERIEAPVRLRHGRGPVNFVLTILKDPSYWRELAFVFLRMIVAPLAFALPLFSLLFGVYLTTQGLTAAVFGVAAVLLAPLTLLALTSVQVSMARTFLGADKQTLVARVDTAVHHRDLSIAAAEAERQRIERDLHDGAQARLATVALDLGRAKRRIEREGGDHELTQIIDSAHNDAKEAIVELRNLARGIHPAVLTDRGLDAALSNVAARCTVPVHLDVHMLTRPAAHIESAAYFAVSELLTNITKHSQAGQAWVTVRGDEDRLRIDVSDNGIGGADHALGSGLLGLRDRMQSIDGELTIRSPLAGGTSCYIEIPLQQVRHQPGHQTLRQAQ